jgi:hypothetical protein
VQTAQLITHAIVCSNLHVGVVVIGELWAVEECIKDCDVLRVGTHSSVIRLGYKREGKDKIRHEKM